ncbi:MAG: type II toxin-antitoxin system VapC family toxin [Planctomycetaceae bacterium]
MMLTDTGPLVALLNRRDPAHSVCDTAVGKLAAGPLLTTWPCLTEAMYLLYRSNGERGPQALWDHISKERIEVVELSLPVMFRMQELMEKYSNVPMDLADASLIAVAEWRGIRRLFTLDGDFRIYRLNDGTSLELIP